MMEAKEIIDRMARDAIEANLSDEQIATRIVSMLIMDKGLVNAWQRTIETMLKVIRAIDRIKATTQVTIENNYVSGHAIAHEAAMSQWDKSLKRPDLDDRTRVQGAIDAYERQLFACAIIARELDTRDVNGQEA